MEIKKSSSWATPRDPVKWLVALFSAFTGIMFFVMQTGKLFRPEAAAAEMAKYPIGVFDWGFVWADTFVPGPLLLIGGILFLLKNSRIGLLFIFCGFTINLYAMIFFAVGLHAVGSALTGEEILVNAIWTLLGFVCMVVAAYRITKPVSG